MKKKLFALLAFILFSSHDMYLKLDTFFLEPSSRGTIQLFNGTFDKSENVIDRDRIADASLFGNGERSQVDTSQWRVKDSITILDFTTGETGTWVAGISTDPRTIEMKADDFNTYLEHDGVLDMLDFRRENDELKKNAVEKYSKHVKAIFQVGDTRTDDWQKALDYPIEFVPLSNPYDLNTGDELQLKLLRNGEPLADQLVYADYRATEHGHSHGNEKGKTNDHKHETGKTDSAEKESIGDHDHDQTEAHSHDDGQEHSHDHEKESAGHTHGNTEEHTHQTGHTHDNKHTHEAENMHGHDQDVDRKEEAHQHTSGSQLRTDDSGIVNVALIADGIWYLRTIDLVKSEEPDLTHESNWATLTFEVVHGHDEETHSHDDAHDDGIPSYVYWIGSVLLIGGLFFWFNRKN